ncbi:haloacid dehalogenase superfamily, subfamily IA, variant 3 with third motif having DD or ED, partial [gut metagenome]
MVFAFKSGEDGGAWFKASLAIAVFVPVLAYAMTLMYRFLKRKGEKKTGMIKNVIFDVGKVLVDFQWEAYLRSFGFSEEKYEKIAAATFQSEIWNERDRGLLKEEEYVEQFVQKAPEYEKEIREVVRRSGETIVPFDYALTWVKYLKEQGYHLYILSNY